MRATLHINSKEELRVLLRKKPLVQLRFENKRLRAYFAIIIALLSMLVLLPIEAYMVGHDKGAREGYSEGYGRGYDAAVQEVVTSKGLNFSEAMAWNVRLHLDQYLKWFVIVIGIAWVLHGVGFHLVKR